MTCLIRPERRTPGHLAAALLPCRFLVLTGPTGSGKTALLRRMILQGAQALDLEALAAHRGSAFGAYPGQAQPSAVELSIRIERYLRATAANRPIWVEAKGAMLGQLALPQPLLEQLERASTVVLCCDEPSRIQNLLASYGSLPSHRLSKALQKLKNRLPRDDLQRASRSLAQGDRESAIRIVLAYYDRAYAKPAPARVLHTIDMTLLTIDACAARLLQAFDLRISAAPQPFDRAPGNQ